MSMSDRGFASMSKERVRKVAQQGGQEAQRRGTAHRWTSEEAREAGRKGGLSAWTKRNAAKAAAIPAPQVEQERQ